MFFFPFFVVLRGNVLKEEQKKQKQLHGVYNMNMPMADAYPQTYSKGEKLKLKTENEHVTVRNTFVIRFH